MLQPWRKGVVMQLANETANTRRFLIKIPELEVFDFEPGQFVTLDLPIHDQKNKRMRSYSIASEPNGSNQFELLIKKFDNGAGGSHFIFEHLQEGSEITFRGPQGVFLLPEQLNKPIYFICTGTGVAPFRSMIKHIERRHLPHHNIYLIFGCRLSSDMLYEAEFRQLEKTLKGFCYLPVFSREAPAPGIDTGYVHSIYERMYNHHKEASLFYLCGWRNMIDEARARLSELGVDKKDIHYELYG